MRGTIIFSVRDELSALRCRRRR